MANRSVRPCLSCLVVVSCVLVAVVACPALAVSTDRAANLFSGDEEFIVLKTKATSEAQWRLTNDYGETIRGSATVADGDIRIPICGLRYGRYTFAVDGDGQVVGGIVPPLIQRSNRFTRCVLAAPQFHSANGRGHWAHPEEALMWKQFEIELRHEFQLDPLNPAKGQYTWPADFETYCQALKKHDVRSGFKFGGAPRWNGGFGKEPVNYDDYIKGLQTVAEHYYPYGMDRYWVGNEPETFGWWDKTDTTWVGYYRWLAATTKALHAADPNIVVNAPECWSYTPKFLNAILKSKDVTVLSVHYPGEDISSDPHADYYYTEMRKTGVWLPMLNGESHAGPNNFQPAVWNKFYLGVGANATGFGYGVSLIGNIDFGIDKTCWMYKSDTNVFDSYRPGAIVPHECGFTIRTVTDQLAGAQMRGRIPDAPTHVIGWLFRRGGDNFVAALVGEATLTQMMEIQTSAKRLRVVDLFGNEYPATPVDGKVRVLLTTAEVYVHGLGDYDAISFPRQEDNEPPEIADTGAQLAAVGAPYRLRLAGRDPDANVVPQSRRLPYWRIIGGPEGMTVRPVSGLVEWTPDKAGKVSFEARLIDADGGSTGQKIEIDVKRAGANLPPEIVSLPALATIVDQPFGYAPKAIDPNADKVSFTVNGPAGMTIKDGAIRWQPTQRGGVKVVVIADDGKGGTATQEFEVVVVPDPDSAYASGMAPRTPTYLTVTGTGDAVTLVWNTQSLGQNVVESAPSPDGPWTKVGETPESWFRDWSPDSFYRVYTRNDHGVSDPAEPVDGRNRAPLADAGRCTRIAKPGVVALDGGKSFDPEGKPLTYAWTIHTAPRGSKGALDEPTGATPKLTLDAPGRYILSLRVSDGQVESRPSYLRVHAGSSHPMEQLGDAGPPQIVTLGQEVSATAWSTPATRKQVWLWRRDDMPIDAYVPFAGRQSNYTRTCRFTPSAPGVYRMQFTPFDDWMTGFPDVTLVIVTPPEPAQGK